MAKVLNVGAFVRDYVANACAPTATAESSVRWLDRLGDSPLVLLECYGHVLYQDWLRENECKQDERRELRLWQEARDKCPKAHRLCWTRMRGGLPAYRSKSCQVP